MRSLLTLRYLESMSRGIRRFPLVLLAALIATAATILANHHDGNQPLTDECWRLFYSMIFAIPLFVTSSLVGELFPIRRRISHLLSVLVVLLFWFFLPKKIELESDWVRYWMLVLAALGTASFVSGLGKSQSANCWRMNIAYANAIILSAIMTLIVLGGLELACYSADKLFSLHLKKIYADLFFVSALFIAPLGIISLIPEAEEELLPSLPGFALWGNLCKWVLLPLGFLFVAILGAYALQILIRWKLPDGLVATPVLSLGAYGTVAMFLLQPWRESHAWARWFSKIYPWAFLLFSLLLFISLEKRFASYGVTFSRYFALSAGIWFFASALFFLLRLRLSLLLVPLLLAILALSSAMGPLGAPAVSLHSQSDRLSRFLALPVSEKKNKYTQIESVVAFLVNGYGIKSVEKVTGPLEIKKTINRWGLTGAVMEKLGLHQTESISHFNQECGSSVPTQGAKLLYPLSGLGDLPLGKSKAGQELKLRFVGDKVEVVFGSRNQTLLDLKVTPISPVTQPTEHEAEFAPIPLSIDGREFLLVVLEGNLKSDASGKRTLSSLSRCILLEK